MVYTPYDVKTLQNGQIKYIRLVFSKPDNNDVSIKLNGKLLKPMVKSQLLDSGVTNEMIDRFDRLATAVCRKLNNQVILSLPELELVLTDFFGGEETLKRKIPFLQTQPLLTGYVQQARKVDKTFQFTRRVTKMVKGKLKKSNTRLTFYPHKVDAALHTTHKCSVDLLQPNFSSHTAISMHTHDDSALIGNEETVYQNLLVSKKGIDQWKMTGGLEKALKIHDEFYQDVITKPAFKKDQGI